MTSWEQAPSVGIVLLAMLAGIGALYVGREFFIPIARALLLNTLLRPLVRGLERLRIPPWRVPPLWCWGSSAGSPPAASRSWTRSARG
jgi:predicted PurR-regulated permease PerM